VIPTTQPTAETSRGARANGPAAATVLSVGIGSALYGLSIVLSEAVPRLKTLLTWSDPVGPLSGKTGVGLITWLFSWAVLHAAWKTRDVPFGRVWGAALVLLAVAFLLTFPPIYDLFTRH
jgi:hypothetical protein